MRGRDEAGSGRVEKVVVPSHRDLNKTRKAHGWEPIVPLLLKSPASILIDVISFHSQLFILYYRQKGTIFSKVLSCTSGEALAFVLLYTITIYTFTACSRQS